MKLSMLKLTYSLIFQIVYVYAFTMYMTIEQYPAFSPFSHEVFCAFKNKFYILNCQFSESLSFSKHLNNQYHIRKKIETFSFFSK